MKQHRLLQDAHIYARALINNQYDNKLLYVVSERLTVVLTVVSSQHRPCSHSSTTYMASQTLRCRQFVSTISRIPSYDRDS